MRKTIALCVSGFNWDCESQVVEGVFRKCEKNDINLLIFSTLVSAEDKQNFGDERQNIIKGETEIFNLINYDMLDGLLIIGDSFLDMEWVEKIALECKRHNVPIVNINSKNPFIKHNVYLDRSCSLDLVIEHLIEVHKCKTVNFIGGIPGHEISEERLESYKRSLLKYNIPVEERRIGFGYFWNQAVDVVKRFILDNVIPDAIVCANDTMALFVMDFLRNSGYKVPEDIIVTGYDGIEDGETYDIPVTTIIPNFERAGSEAFDFLVDIIEGKTDKTDIIIDPALEIRKSCGCNRDTIREADFYKTNNHMQLDAFNKFNIDLSIMNRLYVRADDEEAMYDSLLKATEVFHFTKMFMCINNEVLDHDENFFPETEKGKYSTLSEDMVSVIKNSNNIPVGTKFKTLEILPFDFLNQKDAVTMAFSPLYFKKLFLGYIAYEIWKIKGNGKLFPLWVMTASNYIGSFYNKKELESMYMRDSLTGLYNRRGMKKLFRKTYEEIQNDKLPFAIICADIDKLKTINDAYGHEAGDVAIVKTAEALKLFMPDNAICIRTGGDEYCILLYGDDINGIDKSIEGINKYFTDFNASSGLPYSVSCSFGYCVENNREGAVSLEELQVLADKELYKEKDRKKSGK